MADRSVRLVAFAGSTRRGSFNASLIRLAAADAREAGAQVQLVDLGDFPMPLYNADVEASDGLPTGTRLLKAMLRESDGVLIASPEYNSSITPLMKNTIDWLSRAETDDEPSLAAFRGKVAGLVSASPGHLGGLRGLAQLRAILSHLGMYVIPNQRAVSLARKAFDDTGALVDEAERTAVRAVARSVVDVAGKLAVRESP